MPSSTSESCARICGCWCAGKTSMIRLMVDVAEFVCSVPKVKWPVSAMRSADSMVSRSRISPMSTTSGSSRSAARSASVKRLRVGVQLALVDDAVLVRVQELDRVFDREDVVVALAVDLVDHRGQRRRLARAGRARSRAPGRAACRRSCSTTGGRPSCLNDLISYGMRRKTAADRAALVEDVGAEAGQSLRCRRRSRARGSLRSGASARRSGRSRRAAWSRPASAAADRAARRWPCTRICGGELVVMCRSLPFISSIVLSRSLNDKPIRKFLPFQSL